MHTRMPKRPMAERGEPRTSEGAGLVLGLCVRDAAAGERQAQTAAGSSSTRRLRVRFESIGMPGPIVVLSAAFLM